MHTAALNGIMERNAALVKTQSQIASGKRIETPADDPSGAVRALDLDRALAESQQFGRNADVATSRLSLDEQSLADVTSLLQRVRDLTVQGANATVDQAGRQAIATELKSRLEQLVGIANRKDGTGEYLYSGYATLTQPFSTVGNTVQYAGDQGVRTLQTSPTQSIADGHNGFQVFQQVAQGNGTFFTGAAAANTGTGIIDTGNVTNPTAWVPGSYTLQFTTPTAWQVVDSTSTVVASGAYSTGAAIAFNGVQVTVTGAPAAGDEFTIATSGNEDMFTTLNKLITTLGRPGVTPADKAQFSTEMGATLTQLDSALDHTSGLRAEVGARLSILDDAQSTRADRELDLTTSVSQLRDLDYATAITQLNVQMAGLQAAQSSYTKLSQLSLFNYL